MDFAVPPNNIGFAVINNFNGMEMRLSKFEIDGGKVGIEWVVPEAKRFKVFDTRFEAAKATEFTNGDVCAVNLTTMEFVDEINDVGWVLSSYNRYERTIVYYVGFPSFEADRILQIAQFLTTPEKVTRRLKELQKRFPARAIEVVPVVVKNNGEIDLLSHVLEGLKASL